MHRRDLGRTGLSISVLGFGGWQIGGPGGRFAWDSQDEVISIAAVRAACDAGVDWIDTAPSYGLGRSEEVVARAIRGLDVRPRVFTKCGIVWDDRGQTAFDLTPSSLRDQVRGSLRRLRSDALDLVHIHWPVPETDLEAGWGALAELKREGLVRAIGVSNVSVAQMERLRPIAPVDAAQPSYSLLDRRVEDDVLPYCAEHGIGVLAYSPLRSGLLAGTMTKKRLESLPERDWRRSDPQFQRPHIEEFLSFVESLRPVAARLEVSVAELAVAWVLRNAVVTGAIVGIARPEQVSMILGAASLQLDESVVGELDELLKRTITLHRPRERFVPAPGG
jgi:aryl-alcohol dehydrogenase-like predicted oxidoreductase